MTELIEVMAASWEVLLLVIVIFGFAPGFTLRLLVMIYPQDDPRRQELIAELYTLGRLERPLFVAEQLETMLVEGLPHRLHGLVKKIKSCTKKKTKKEASPHQPAPAVRTTARQTTDLVKGARITGSTKDKLAADLRKKYEQGASIRALAESTGRSYGFVHRVLSESGVQLRGRGGATRG